MSKPALVVKIEVAIEEGDEIQSAIQDVLDTARSYGAAGVTGCYTHRDFNAWVQEDSRSTIKVTSPVTMTFN